MGGVTENGFVTETYQEIFDDITTKANSEEYFGVDFPTTVDSAFGILNAIFSAALKDGGWDQAEAVYNQFNRDKAEGKNLDDLAALVGITRFEDTSSSGELFFIGSNGSTIPSGLSVQDNDKSVVLTTSSYTYNRTACYYVQISVGTVIDSTDYTIILDDNTYTYTSGAGATETEIINGLFLAIGATGSATATVNEDSTILYITRDTTNNGMSVTPSNELSLDFTGLIAEAQAAETGELTFSAGTLTTITTPGDAVGTESVTNLEDFELGRVEETDEELRLRMASGASATGTATVPAIQSSLEDISGVTNVKITENITMVTDGDGRPAKSYECFVQGGSEQDIGDTLWETKPAGIETYGNTQVLVTDDNGDEQAVYFTRATNLYAHVQVTYTLFDEESFPSNGEDLIIAAVVEYGNELGAGTDVIPQRFNGKIFDAVDGLESVVTEIGLTAAPGDTPTYQTTKIVVADSEVAVFADDRVSVSI